jgi:crotonobetainyl-CoA:carnitine CoA-transferase CaiB-like acyl-CoA transferase
MTAPLSHIRVLDMSRILAGPWAGQLLADLGAEVIKIERPGSGDDTRQWGPPYFKDENGRETTESAYYLSANRGKKSLTLDITTPAGQQVVRDLVPKCDVLIENYKVGGLARYGLDYESLAQVNPRLVYCSITGFGQTGPYSQRAGYDVLIQAMGGLMSITGEQDDLPGGGPQKVGVALADILTGMYASSAIQAALLERERSSEGQYIDLSLLDVQAATLANQASNYLVGGMVPRRLGNAHPNIVPYQAFATSDGHMILAVGNDQQFSKFCELAGCPELADDERYSTNRARVENRDVLCGLIQSLLRERSTAEWIRALEEIGVPCGPINTIDQVFDEPQIKARGMQVDLPHPLGGDVSLVGNPIKFSRTPVQIESPPPTLGEHSEQVLRELLGYSEEQIKGVLGSTE